MPDPQHTTVSVSDLKTMLDDLFTIRTSLATLSAERDAAVLRQLPLELQETVMGILREFAETQEQREQEERDLTETIRAAATLLGRPVEGTHLHVTVQAGRRTWDTERLLPIAERLPEVKACLRVGDPIFTIRARTQRQKTSPLLYDTHGI